jgi:ligand-binding sensor domain-containing protein
MNASTPSHTPARRLPSLCRVLGLGLALGLAHIHPAAAQPAAAPSSAATTTAAPPAASNAAGSLRVEEVYEVGASLYVRALAIEPARQALWVGTSAGVHEIDLADGHVRQTFTREQGLANEYVFAIGIDRLGRKWFGTNAGGVSRYESPQGDKPAQWKTFFPMHGLADYWVYAFAEQKKSGDLWIGTWAGANKVDARSGKFTTYVKQLVNEWVYGIAVDAQDRVWFGTEGGVTRFDGKTWRSWTHADGLGAPNLDGLPVSANTGLGTRSRHDLSVRTAGRGTYNPNYVFAMLSARDGAIWAGTWGGGAARFDGQTWTNLTRQDGLAGNIVYAIAQDASGALWFGTDAGVSRFDGRQWASAGRAQGLADEHVYALAVQADGSVWAGTRGGVARLR